MATATLAGALLTLVFCSTAGAEPVATTSAPSETTTAPVPTSTSKPAPPVTAPQGRKIVLIGTAASVQSSSAIQSVDVLPVQPAAVKGARELPHTGTATMALTLFGITLVLLGALATRGQQPQLRLSERS